MGNDDARPAAATATATATATPDYSGLQVVEEGHNLPEAVVVVNEKQQTGGATVEYYPEVVAPTSAKALLDNNAPPVHSGDPEAYRYHDAAPEAFHRASGAPEPIDHASAPEAWRQGQAAQNAPSKKRFSRRCLILSIVGVVVVIAVVIGCVVGLVVIPNNNKSSTASSSANDPSSPGGTTNTPGLTNTTVRSACTGSLCPQILSAVQQGPNLMLFARGLDNAIWYNAAPIASLSPWSSSSTWQSLGGGPFASQPVSWSWTANGTGTLRIAVVAIGESNRGAHIRQYFTNNNTWSSEWRNMFGDLESAPSLCSIDGTRLDVWALGGDTVAHNFFIRGEDAFWAPDKTKDWQGSADWRDLTLKSRPAVACRWNDFGHDLIVYDGQGRAVHSMYSGDTAWIRPFVWEGAKFVGEPTVLMTTNERLDFFGVDAEGRMWHGKWTDQGGHGKLTDLGGKFESVPGVVVTGGGSRVDVLALGGGTATLQHRVMVSDKWSDAWEDLGVRGNSAPLLYNLTTTPESVAMFVLGEDGEVNQTVWRVSADLSWKNLVWRGMGGELTTAGLATI
ncbi:hypothetical protein OQA88_2376 [Cercophora sp. LCS_1]